LGELLGLAGVLKLLEQCRHQEDGLGDAEWQGGERMSKKEVFIGPIEQGHF